MSIKVKRQHYLYQRVKMILSKVLALYSYMESFKLNLKQDKNQIETFRNYSHNCP